MTNKIKAFITIALVLSACSSAGINNEQVLPGDQETAPNHNSNQKQEPDSDVTTDDPETKTGNPKKEKLDIDNIEKCECRRGSGEISSAYVRSPPEK
ncbi:hypothetical protein [Paenibacillus faecalis]|uniref:hypothetical protein n=1 Tax=Paenibacillus faecalis TaxID=2079532 RepID=UPI000D0FBD4E|nr:hypothetical protein [Paenibacillus faecalis]